MKNARSSPFKRRLPGRLFLVAGLAVAVLAPLAFGGPARAAAPFTLSHIEVKSAGTYAVVTFYSSEPALVSAEYKPVTGAAPAQRVGQSGAAAQGFFAGPIPVARHELKLTGLTSNTAYNVTLNARTGDNRTATAAARFTTAKKRIRVTLSEIDIQDDGDLIGKGEPSWGVYVKWDGGAGGGCFPLPCGRSRKYEEGRFTPFNSEGKALQILLAEENFDRFPDAISLEVTASEDDGRWTEPLGWRRFLDCVTDAVADGGCTIGEDSLTVWRVPQGVESSYEILKVGGDADQTGFRSVLTFRVELVHHDVPLPTSKRNTAYSTWK